MNKELLLEDVKFPLKWDTDMYKMYIFDKEMSMIAMVDRNLDATVDEHPFEKLIGAYKEVERRPDSISYEDSDTISGDGNFPPNMFTLKDGEFIERYSQEPIGMVRGWGRLQYKDKAEERQDNIAQYILNVINT